MSVPAANVFGPLVSGDEVEDAVTATLKFWLPTYVHELERRKGREVGAIPEIRAWTTVNRFQQRPGDQLPTAIIVSPGWEEAPQKGGGGVYGAWWLIDVAVLVGAKDQAAANQVAKLYAAAVTAVLVHKASLGGFSSAFRLLDQGYTEAPPDYLPVAAVAAVSASFFVEGVVQSGRGPQSPDGGGDFGQVHEVDIDAYATREGSGQAPDLMHLVKEVAP